MVARGDVVGILSFSLSICVLSSQSWLLNVAGNLLFSCYGSWLIDRYKLSAASMGVLSLAVGSGEFVGDLIIILTSDRCRFSTSVLLSGAILIPSYLALGLLVDTYNIPLVAAAVIIFATFTGFETGFVANLAKTTEVATYARSESRLAYTATIIHVMLLFYRCHCLYFFNYLYSIFC